MDNNTTPVNALTNKPYQGSNIGTLIEAMVVGGYDDPRFMTFKQALELGRVVRKGQKAAARIVKFRTATAEEQKKDGRKIRSCGSWAVFNWEQTDPLPADQTVAA